MTTKTELRDAWRFMLRLADGSGAPQRLLAAVSGGLDSMCLLQFLLDWTAEMGGEVFAAHFNHRLRGEAADWDESFVRNWCRERGIPFLRGEGEVRAYAKQAGLTLEEAARQMRYSFLERTAAERRCGWILTAHHADDNAETMLLNLIRGAGSRGLAGIPAVRGRIARPFLRLERAELERYAAARGIPHVEDETNRDPDAAARNRLRQKVMPVLRELNPRAAQNMGRTAAILSRENAFLDQQAKALAAKARIEDGALCMPRRELNEAPPALAAAAVLELLERACGGRKNLTAVDAETVLDFCRNRPGRWELRLSYNLVVRGEGEELVISVPPLPPGPAAIWPGRTVTFGEWDVTLGVEPGPAYTYRIALPGGVPLSVTAWQKGDRMTLPGARGSRTLKRLCADAGVRPWQRDALPVLRVGEAAAAVPGVGLAEGFVPGPDEKAWFVTFYKNRDKEEAENEKRNGAGYSEGIGDGGTAQGPGGRAGGGAV